LTLCQADPPSRIERALDKLYQANCLRKQTIVPWQAMRGALRPVGLTGQVVSEPQIVVRSQEGRRPATRGKLSHGWRSGLARSVMRLRQSPWFVQFWKSSTAGKEGSESLMAEHEMMVDCSAEETHEREVRSSKEGLLSYSLARCHSKHKACQSYQSINPKGKWLRGSRTLAGPTLSAGRRE